MKRFRSLVPVFCFLLLSCKREFSYEKKEEAPSLYFVTTLAGTGTAGFTDGTAANSLFNAPKGIAIDAQGNLYIGDTGNNRLRKISGNTVITLAGKGNAGYADGSGTAALFNAPADLITDEAGTIYLADMNNNRVRRVTPDGEVSTVAGGSRTNNPDGSNMFNQPRGISRSDNGLLYVVDIYNHCVRTVSATGEISLFAGSGKKGYKDGPAAVAQFHTPKGLVRDRADNLYVADMGNHCIRKITPSSEVTTVAGKPIAGFKDGLSQEALFNEPRGIAIDSEGNLYISDTNNNRIRLVTTNGIVTTIAGDGQTGLVNGPGPSARFTRPRAVVVDRQDKFLYVADQSNHAIRRISLP